MTTEQLRIEALVTENAALRADAERARWCEEMKADVDWDSKNREWRVFWIAATGTDIKTLGSRHPDRNAAIDAAMKEGR